jgi:hypothetical protein
MATPTPVPGTPVPQTTPDDLDTDLARGRAETGSTTATGSKAPPVGTSGYDKRRKHYDPTRTEGQYYEETAPVRVERADTKGKVIAYSYEVTRTYEDGTTYTYRTNEMEVGKEIAGQPALDWQWDEGVNPDGTKWKVAVPSGPASLDAKWNKDYKEKAAKYAADEKQARKEAADEAKLESKDRADADKAAKTPPKSQVNPITGNYEEWQEGRGSPGEMDYVPPGWQIKEWKKTDDEKPEWSKDPQGNIVQYNKKTGKWEKVYSADIDPLEASKFEWQKSRDLIRDDLAAGRLSFDQAKFQAEKEFERIRLGLQAEQSKLTQRGQDVTQRGQDMDMATRLAVEASQAQMASLAYRAPKGARAELAKLQNAALASSGSTYRVDPNPVSQPFPFDPGQVAIQAANRVLGNVSPAAQAAGATPQPGFQLPRAIGPVTPPTPTNGFYLPQGTMQTPPPVAAAPAAATPPAATPPAQPTVTPTVTPPPTAPPPATQPTVAAPQGAPLTPEQIEEMKRRGLMPAGV